MHVISGLYSNIFSLKWALQRGFRVTSKEEPLILKEISTNNFTGEKMANNGVEGFIHTAKLI